MYVINSDADEPIMLLDKHIGFDQEDGMGIDGALFQQELLRLDSLGKKRIHVWINSPGGLVIEGYNIYNAILKSKTPVDTYCYGLAGSIAGVIFQAGRKRIMADYGILMYHNPFGGESSDGIEAMRNSICTMISVRSGKTCEEIEKIMNRETFMSAEEAVGLGMADSIEVSSDFNKKRLTPALAVNTVSYWKESGKILNKILKTDTMSFAKIANKLNLNPEASEDAIVTALVGVFTRAEVAEGELAKVTNKAKTDLEKAKNDMDEATNKFNKLQADFDAMKKEKDEAEEASKTEKAKNMITAFANAGKIKNEATEIAKWTSLAKADFEGTKGLIEGLPVNKIANKITTQQEGDAPKRSFGGEMGRIRANTQNKG